TLRRTLRPPLFPYTTLFRSDRVLVQVGGHDDPRVPGPELVELPAHLVREDTEVARVETHGAQPGARHLDGGRHALLDVVGVHQRSEEHTSELQSRENLVCRL